MLPSAKSNRITVDGECYRYIVSKCGTGQDGVIPLAVTIQLPNGMYLRVRGLTAERMPEEPSQFYMGLTLNQVIKPRHVARLIRLGLAHGWKPRLHGPTVTLQIGNSELFAAPIPIARTHPQQDTAPSAVADDGE